MSIKSGTAYITTTNTDTNIVWQYGALDNIKLPIIIAECGNNHMGNMNFAFELLNAAKESGADLVKFQAGSAKGFARDKSQIKRYKQFELGLANYKRLIEYGHKIGIPVFFSIWGEGFDELREMEQFHKIAARQCNQDNIEKYDSENTFISVPKNAQIIYEPDKKYKSIFMHVVSEYPTYDPQLSRIKFLQQIFDKVGYSDHTIGISSCITAVKDFGAIAIEKHFTLPKLRAEYGHVFRDHKHSATPDEFQIMSIILRGG